MDNLKLYLVVKPSSDRTLQIGDLIWISENGDLNSVASGWWLSRDEWDVPGTNDFETEVCQTHYVDAFGGKEEVRKVKK